VRAIVFALALAGCATGEAVSQPASANGAPDWMSGYWLSCADGRETSENWIGAGSGMLVGANLTPGARPQFEFLRISPNTQGGFSYFSMPNGRAPATEFAMVSNDGARAVFENLEHDFPQRIIYRREGDVLSARIENADASQGMNWVFRRAAPDTRCG
jgi:hypothetical protein